MPSLRSLDPEFRVLAENFVREVNLTTEWLQHPSGGGTARKAKLIVTSARRSFLEQTKLYSKYLYQSALGQKVLPVAVPGSSMHEQGLAFDLMELNVSVWEPESMLWDAGRLWAELGGKWSPKDPVHFEVPEDW